MINTYRHHKALEIEITIKLPRNDRLSLHNFWILAGGPFERLRKVST